MVTIPNYPFLKPTPIDSCIKCALTIHESLGSLCFRNTYFQHFENSKFIHVVSKKYILRECRIPLTTIPTRPKHKTFFQHNNGCINVNHVELFIMMLLSVVTLVKKTTCCETDETDETDERSS